MDVLGWGARRVGCGGHACTLRKRHAVAVGDRYTGSGAGERRDERRRIGRGIDGERKGGNHVHGGLLSGQLWLSGAGDVHPSLRGRRRQGHAEPNDPVAGERHAGRAAGPQDGAARGHDHRSGHLRRPCAHRPGQGSAEHGRRCRREQHDRRHRAGADGVRERGAGGVPGGRSEARQADPRHRYLGNLRARGDQPGDLRLDHQQRGAEAGHALLPLREQQRGGAGHAHGLFQCRREHRRDGAGQGPEHPESAGERPARGLRPDRRAGCGRRGEGELYEGVCKPRAEHRWWTAGAEGAGAHLHPV